MKRVLERLKPYWAMNQPNQWNWPPEENYYEWYALYASLVKPDRVLEIGVMYGWSAMAFLAGWPGIQEMVLVDNELYGISLEQSADQVRRFCLDQGWTPPNILTIKGDSIVLASVDAFGNKGLFDLIHVDGEHSAAAVRSDVLAGLKILSPRGTIVVDDTTGIPALHAAVGLVRAGRGDVSAAEIPTFTGHTLLWKRSS